MTEHDATILSGPMVACGVVNIKVPDSTAMFSDYVLHELNKACEVDASMSAAVLRSCGEEVN